MTRSATRLPIVLPQRCTGCGRCVGACDLHLLSLHVVHWKKSALLHDIAACTGCSACAVACPFHAIVMRRPGVSSGHVAPGSS